MFDGPEPIYVQIAEQVRSGVLHGALLEGEQVTSTTQYATQYRINPATAAKAFAQLVEEGVLEKRRGIGMFVRDGARERLRSQRALTFVADVLEPVLREAVVLGIGADQLHAVVRRHAADQSSRSAW